VDNNGMTVQHRTHTNNNILAEGKTNNPSIYKMMCGCTAFFPQSFARGKSGKKKGNLRVD
jgi:hypothetical protein